MDKLTLVQELGLGPLWQLRRRAAAESLPTVAPTATSTDITATAAVPQLAADWPALAQAVEACRACALGAQRRRSVLGVGDPRANWLFVGEGPGAEEDQRGEPFVGQAGKLLDAMLAAIGLRRGEDVYIANIVKCRPPGNRTPERSEIDACFGYLEQQIALLQPRLLVALGKCAAQALLGGETSIAAARGKVHRVHGLPLIVSYHPDYLLSNLPDKAKAWEDLTFMRQTMAMLKENQP